ncbi:Allantoinase AllB [Kibdelosporangium sp. 4NS15]|uniref:allantoinase n=1 Tax=Kibdelosporangium persicum TaxID=2698649 RepID=A0ABX2FD73_9PSEU|nr:Allantoinase AllB [Kibdelosporangium persicum]
MLDLVFRARRMITSAGETEGTVGVREGRIVAVEPLNSALDADRVIELGANQVLLPGLVDTHVHVNDPGRTEWEGFKTATRAAAAGGVTTLLDMPLNSLPPTVDVEALDVKRKTAEGRLHVDVGFWGGAVPGNVKQLRPMHEAGVFGFKSFLLHSGVDEFGHLSFEEFEAALSEMNRFNGLMIVHAEDEHSITSAGGRKYADFLASRPERAENTAISRVIGLARRTGARVHILHLSSASALPMIAEAKAEGIELTVETCPHYLTFVAEEIPDGATQFKCCPPIREAANREALWRGLADGLIDFVVSDHSPTTVQLKRFDTGDFGDAWGGIAGLQVGLPAVWTQARRRGHTMFDVAEWMAHRPAKLAGMRHKGQIAPGYDADFCVFAPDEAFVVQAEQLHHRNPVTAYHGVPLAGRVVSTWLRGIKVTGEEMHGDLLGREDA